MSVVEPGPSAGGQMPRDLPEPGKFVGEAVAALVAWRIRAGALVMLAIGGVLLGIAWKGASQWYRYEHMLGRLTGRATATVEQEWWQLVPLERARSFDWWIDSQAELHAIVSFTTAEGRRVRVAYRSPRRIDLTRWAPGPDALLTPALHLPWVDAAGEPRAELRFAADDYAWLTGTQARDSWPLQYWWGPDDERPAPGTEMDALWYHLDQPLDLLARAWAAPATGPVAIAYDPTSPESALPLPLPDATTRRGNGVLAFAFMAGIGGLFWIFGSAALWKVTPWWLVVPVFLLPLLLPFSANGFQRVLGWVSPKGATAFFGDLESSVDYGREHGLLMPQAPTDDSNLRSRIWSYRESHFAPVLARFTLRRPEPPPADADAAWAAISEQLAAQVAALDEDAQRELLMQLMQEVRFGQTGLGYAFVEAARRMAGDPSRSDNLHEWATAYVKRTVEHNSLPNPSEGQVGYPAARAVVTLLAGDADPDVRKYARRELDEADEILKSRPH
jgi:hypothetical protein